MKVKALKVGYYAHRRYKEGEEFVLKPIKVKIDGKTSTIPPEKQFSQNWMMIVDADFTDDDESAENQVEASPAVSEKQGKSGKSKGKSSVAAESESPLMSA